MPVLEEKVQYQSDKKNPHYDQNYPIFLKTLYLSKYSISNSEVRAHCTDP
jgi:hypothetical protein